MATMKAKSYKMMKKMGKSMKKRGGASQVLVDPAPYPDAYSQGPVSTSPNYSELSKASSTTAPISFGGKRRSRKSRKMSKKSRK
jgi:hypothetical protein